MPRPRLRTLAASAIFASIAAGFASPALAQDGAAHPEDEQAGHARGGYAWGQAPVDESGNPVTPTYRRYGTAFAHLGFGGTVRIVAHADICDPGAPGREGCRFSPLYLQLRGGYMFETDSMFQHGVGLGIATNLAPDGTSLLGIDPGAQWVFTPAYFLRVWLDDWFQILGHFGVPLSVANVTSCRGPNCESVDTAFNWALELGIDLVVKFFTGLGIYAGAMIDTWFAGQSSVWPSASFHGGLVFDYEVLP